MSAGHCLTHCHWVCRTYSGWRPTDKERIKAAKVDFRPPSAGVRPSRWFILRNVFTFGLPGGDSKAGATSIARPPKFCAPGLNPRRYGTERMFISSCPNAHNQH